MGNKNSKQKNEKVYPHASAVPDSGAKKEEQTDEDINGGRKKENGPFKFHKETEQNLVDYVKTNTKAGGAQAIIECVDAFCWDNHWMMNIGPDKGKILDMAVAECKPKYILELGAYCGYSSIRMVKTNKAENGINDTRLYSIEIDEKNTAIANELIAYAGYSENICIYNKSSVDMIPELKETIAKEDEKFDGFDLIFIDHSKGLYLSDLKLIEANGLVKKGSYVVADNVIVFQMKEYLDYVRKSGLYESKIYESFLEYDISQKHKDGVEISIKL